ncbi:MAG: PEP-CTERM sorting domain-containing protein [Cyanobacteria bacterium]|nr:PEP-CTERM sorting domain-containing protein [Cyanobacteriota bacterium]MDW8202868.1 PEP-CTERM sorting domain-containing protein [Cyanobacteriota bacterium SKYGB_h_bin112]
MTIFRTLVMMTATVLLSCTIADIKVAQAGSLYKLTFYDTTNAVVGEGSFETSDTPYEATITSELMFPTITITAADQLYVVTNFLATVHGASWDLTNTRHNDVLLWTGNSLTQPKTLGLEGRSPIYSMFDQWWFYKGFRSTMFHSQFSIWAGDPQDGDMTWLQASAEATPGYWVSSGRVTATAIPEPMTIAGLALAGIGLAATRRRLAMAQKQPSLF